MNVVIDGKYLFLLTCVCMHVHICIVTLPCDIFLEVCVFFIVPQVHAALENPTGNRFLHQTVACIS